MLKQCDLPPQLIEKLARDHVPTMDLDGAPWEAFSDEYRFSYWRITSTDGTIKWYRVC